MANVNFSTPGSQKVQGMWPDDYVTCDEGGEYVATNPTVGTGLTGTVCVDDAATASSTHAQYAPFILMYNKEIQSSPNPYSLYLKFMKFMILTPPGTASVWRYSVRIDSVNRWASGGTAITPVNSNPNSSQGSITQFNAGALVPTALPSNNARLVATGYFDSTIPVVGDQYLIRFGNAPMPMDELNGGIVAKNMCFNAPPVILPPSWCLAFEWWGTSNVTTAIVSELEVGWIERLTGL